MSYRTQSSLINQLKSVEKEKRYVETKLEKLEGTGGGKRTVQHLGKRDRDQNEDHYKPNPHSSNNRYNSGKNHQNDTKRLATESTMFQRRVVKPVAESGVNSSGETQTGTGETQKRNRMMFGMLNKTLQEFRKDIDKKTESDLKRQEVESKVESIISKEQTESEKREQERKQQIKEKELKHHEDLVKKQELLENKILTEGWNLHNRILADFKYKTNTTPVIYFTLNSLAEKHNFVLKPKSCEENKSSDSESKSNTTSRRRSKDSDKEDDEDEILDKEEMKNEIISEDTNKRTESEDNENSSGNIEEKNETTANDNDI